MYISLGINSAINCTKYKNKLNKIHKYYNSSSFTQTRINIFKYYSSQQLLITNSYFVYIV